MKNPFRSSQPAQPVQPTEASALTSLLESFERVEELASRIDDQQTLLDEIRADLAVAQRHYDGLLKEARMAGEERQGIYDRLIRAARQVLHGVENEVDAELEVLQHYQDEQDEAQRLYEQANGMLDVARSATWETLD